MNVAEQCNCGQHIPLQRWCARLGSGKYIGSLWTAAEAAEIYGCAAHRMGVAMNKLFRRRHVRLGPDDNLGRPLWLYCVWASAPFFSTQPAEIIRKLWREQHAQREFQAHMSNDQLARAATALVMSDTSRR
jgi:hypothetical protein